MSKWVVGLNRPPSGEELEALILNSCGIRWLMSAEATYRSKNALTVSIGSMGEIVGTVEMQEFPCAYWDVEDHAEAVEALSEGAQILTTPPSSVILVQEIVTFPTWGMIAATIVTNLVGEGDWVFAIDRDWGLYTPSSGWVT